MLDTQTLVSTNPATGEVVGEVPTTDPDRIAAIVAGTREAQRAWGAKSLDERRGIMEPFAQAVAGQEERLARLITVEMGKPVKDAMAEVRRMGPSFHTKLLEIQNALNPEVLEDKHTHSTIYQDPLGVCAVITPWNFPVAMPHSLVIPALMAGNSVVFKPSEETPLVGQAYFEILKGVLPKGLMEIVHGADVQGKALVDSDVDLIAFTGSRDVGKKILAAAAPKLKRVVLELGGKDPLIVMKSADLEQAADFAASNSFRNAGQVCVSTERIYVDRAVAPEFERLLLQKAESFVSGNGLDEGTDVGPMIHTGQRDHVLRQIRQAKDRGARILAGSDTSSDAFIKPTVITNLDHSMDIMREETFGPVACVIPFDTTEEAVEWANNTPFGLGASVFGAPKEALELARRLTSGMIGVNQSCGGAGGSPWVGAKESGYGFHSSKDGHRQFAQTRVISIPR